MDVEGSFSAGWESFQYSQATKLCETLDAVFGGDLKQIRDNFFVAPVRNGGGFKSLFERMALRFGQLVILEVDGGERQPGRISLSGVQDAKLFGKCRVT